MTRPPEKFPLDPKKLPQTAEKVLQPTKDSITYRGLGKKIPRAAKKIQQPAKKISEAQAKATTTQAADKRR